MSSQPDRQVDIEAANHGTIWVLTGVTEVGSTWLKENLDPDATRWGLGFVVEHRYVSDIVVGAQEAGLEVGTQ